MATITVDTKARRHTEERASRGLWRDAFRRLLRNGPAVVGLVLISIFVFAAVFAPVIAPYGPLQGSLADRLQPPSPQHIMGTDLQGRDEYSRILYGAQVSLVVAVGSVIMALIFGGLIGAFAGAAGGKVDNVLMRIVDVLLSIPGILLAIGIVAWLGRGLPQIMLAVALTNTPIFARILRGSLLANRDLDYVNAARSLGARAAPDAGPAHAPELADGPDRRGDPRAGDGHHRRRGARLPGPRPARPADPGVGDDAHGLHEVPALGART